MKFALYKKTLIAFIVALFAVIAGFFYHSQSFTAVAWNTYSGHEKSYIIAFGFIPFHEKIRETPISGCLGRQPKNEEWVIVAKRPVSLRHGTYLYQSVNQTIYWYLNLSTSKESRIEFSLRLLDILEKQGIEEVYNYSEKRFDEMISQPSTGQP